MMVQATEGRETAEEADVRLSKELIEDVLRWLKEAKNTGQFGELQLFGQIEKGNIVSYRGGVIEKHR